MKKILLILFLLLVGCSSNRTPVWNKPNATQDDYARDRYTCLQQSQQVSSSGYIAPNVLLGGYQGFSSSGVGTNFELFNACMNANGWYMVYKNSENQQSKNNKSEPLPLEQQLENERFNKAGDFCTKSGFRFGTKDFDNCRNNFR